MDLSPLLSLIPAKDLIYVTAAVTVCSTIATVLPAPKSGAKGVYPAIYKIVNFIALNVGHATNAKEGNCPRVGGGVDGFGDTKTAAVTSTPSA